MSMKIFFSASDNGFFNTDIHSSKSIPADAVEISVSYYEELMSGQAKGLVIKSDEKGYPGLAAAPLEKEK